MILSVTFNSSAKAERCYKSVLNRPIHIMSSVSLGGKETMYVIYYYPLKGDRK